MRIFNILFFTVILFNLSSCNISQDIKNESLSYSLSVNGCETGSHSFASLSDYCTGLQNNTLNNNCAQTSRESLFNQKCSGTFSPFSNQLKIKINLLQATGL